MLTEMSSKAQSRSRHIQRHSFVRAIRPISPLPLLYHYRLSDPATHALPSPPPFLLPVFAVVGRDGLAGLIEPERGEGADHALCAQVPVFHAVNLDHLWWRRGEKAGRGGREQTGALGPLRIHRQAPTLMLNCCLSNASAKASQVGARRWHQTHQGA